jgi:hypothetical protein
MVQTGDLSARNLHAKDIKIEGFLRSFIHELRPLMEKLLFTGLFRQLLLFSNGATKLLVISVKIHFRPASCFLHGHHKLSIRLIQKKIFNFQIKIILIFAR